MKTILDTDMQERRAKSDLAVDGGQCVQTRKFVPWPSLSEDEGFKDHGKDHGAAHKQQTSSGFRWLDDSFGTNWRLTEMQAAIGRSLLAKLPKQLDLRPRNANILSQRFSTLPALRVTVPPQGIGHAYYKYYVFLRAELMRKAWNRDQLLQAIGAEGIPCFSGSCSEIYLDRWRDASNKVGHLRRAQ